MFCHSDKKNPTYQHFTKDRNLEHNPVIRDLGVFIDNNLTFISHIKTIIQKASTRGGRTVLAKTFTTYVQPLLEYCSQVWNPHLTYPVRGIESVQRTFTKAISSFPHQSYSARLIILGLRSLEHCCVIFDLYLLFKFLNGLMKSDLLHFVQFSKYN